MWLTGPSQSKRAVGRLPGLKAESRKEQQKNPTKTKTLHLPPKCCNIPRVPRKEETDTLLWPWPCHPDADRLGIESHKPPRAAPPHENKPLWFVTLLPWVTLALGAGMELEKPPTPVTPPQLRAQDSLVNADFNFQLIIQLWKLDQQPARSQQSVSVNILHTRSTPERRNICHRLQNSWMESSVMCVPQQAAPWFISQSPWGCSITQLLQHP